MPKLADNDPDKWNYDLHTRVKHEILMRYFKPWIGVLGASGGSLAFVDAFAGRGRYRGGEAGSPLLVLDVAFDAFRQFRKAPREIVFHFVEANPGNFHSLQEELAKHPAMQESRIRVDLRQGTFGIESDQIIAEIRRRQQPSFFFVDPFGYDDPTMDRVEEILQLPRAEVFINLMYNFANRAVGVPNNPALGRTLDRLFGTPDWRTVSALEGEERERRFLELYRQQLKQRGASFAIPFRMGDDTRDRTMYYLIHATKHLRGAMLMKEAMVASASPGQLAYAGERRHRIEPLFNLDVAQLPDLLLNRFAGRTLTFDETIASSIEEAGACRESDYRACLKAMEGTGQVAITRITSKRSGLDGQDQITFGLQKSRLL